MSENNLKNCPLCGKNDLLVDTEVIPSGHTNLDSDEGWVERGFLECLTRDCPIIIREPTIEEVIRKWNIRPIEDSLQSDLDDAMGTLEKISKYTDKTFMLGEKARNTIDKIKRKRNE